MNENIYLRIIVAHVVICTCNYMHRYIPAYRHAPSLALSLVYWSPPRSNDRNMQKI